MLFRSRLVERPLARADKERSTARVSETRIAGVTDDPLAAERRVVLAELRNRDTLAGRQQQASMPVVFRGLRFPEHQPGGRDDLGPAHECQRSLRDYEAGKHAQGR